MNMKKLALPLVLSLLALRCSNDPAPAPASGPAPPPEPAHGFVAEAADGAAIVLRAKQATDKELVVEVVGQKTPALSGVAFRLTWDAKVLTFRSMEVAKAWPGERVELASEPKPGLLLATVGVKGERPGLAAGDPVVATLSFDVAKLGPTSLAFVQERSTAFDDKGAPAALKWRGGALR